MPHIHTEPGQYDLTVSAYIVRTAPVPRILLHKHKTLGVYIQPGGHVELDETPWQAIIHELREETGYDMDQLQILQPYLRPPVLSGDDLHPQPVCLRSFPFEGLASHFHTDITYAFVTEEERRHDVGEGESHDLRWVTREELLAIPPGQTYEDVRQLGTYILDQVLTQWDPVPLIDQIS